MGAIIWVMEKNALLKYKDRFYISINHFLKTELLYYYYDFVITEY